MGFSTAGHSSSSPLISVGWCYGWLFGNLIDYQLFFKVIQMVLFFKPEGSLRYLWVNTLLTSLMSTTGYW